MQLEAGALVVPTALIVRVRPTADHEAWFAAVGRSGSRASPTSSLAIRPTQGARPRRFDAIGGRHGRLRPWLWSMPPGPRA
jgi:hypothetical protein